MLGIRCGASEVGNFVAAQGWSNYEARVGAIWEMDDLRKGPFRLERLFRAEVARHPFQQVSISTTEWSKAGHGARAGDAIEAKEILAPVDSFLGGCKQGAANGERVRKR